jgi:hypothetical protein
MTIDFSIEAFRYADVTIPGNSNLIVPDSWPVKGNYNGGVIPAENDPAASNTGTQVKLQDSTSTVRRNEIYRGIPVSFISNTINTPNKINQVGAFTTFLEDLLNWFKFGSTNPNIQIATVNLRYFVKDPAVNPWFNVTLVSKDPTTGFISLTAYNDTPNPVVNLPWSQGTLVRLSGIRLKCARKLTGYARVFSFAVDTTVTPSKYTIVLCKPFCCAGQPLLCPSMGKLQLATFGYTKITNVNSQIIATRKTGRPFRLRPGRVLRCCS